MKCVREILARQDLVMVSSEVPVSDAARIMADRDIGAVLIADGGRLMGIFTERDALTRIIAAGRDPASTPIGDVMSSSLVMASIDESCESCLERMRQAHIRHLVVLDHGRTAGIVSMRDLMAVDLDDKVETITLLNAYVQSVPDHLGNQRT